MCIRDRFKGVIQQQDPNQVKEAQAPSKQDLRNVSTSKADASTGGTNTGLPQNPQQPARIQPIRVEQKIGRNDPCPCGSGKKYKTCHGGNG